MLPRRGCKDVWAAGQRVVVVFIFKAGKVLGYGKAKVAGEGTGVAGCCAQKVGGVG